VHYVLTSEPVVAFLWLVQAPFFLRQLRMDMETSASSACLCRNVWGNTTLIPENRNVLHNMTFLSDSGCHMQESSVKSENPKVDIEVVVRASC